jgi:hypothetical protein
MRRTTPALFAVVATALAFCACGITTERSPHALEDARLPIDRPAADPARSAATTTSPGVFLVSHDKLIAAPRDADPTAVDARGRLVHLLGALLEGPTQDELRAGLRTAIPPDTQLGNVTLSGAVATIDVTGAFTTVSGQEQVVALAQLVTTATSVPGVDQVKVLIGNRVVEIPRADGKLSSGPVTRADYQSLLTPP